MARNRRTTQQKEVQDYRHDTATRKKIYPQASPHTGKSKKHRSRNTPTIRTYPPTSDPIQTETQTNSPNCSKKHNGKHSPPRKRKPSLMHSDTTDHGWNGQANRRRNPSPSIRLRCISTNASVPKPF